MRVTSIILLYAITYFIYVLLKTIFEYKNTEIKNILYKYLVNLLKNIPIVIGCAIGGAAAILFCSLVKWECSIEAIYPLYFITLFGPLILSMINSKSNE